MKPLNFAILKLFTNGQEFCADDVINALQSEYGSFKALNKKDVLNALMTAESNALIEESRYEVDDQGQVQLYFRANDEGIATINKYIP